MSLPDQPLLVANIWFTFQLDSRSLNADFFNQGQPQLQLQCYIDANPSDVEVCNRTLISRGQMQRFATEN